MKLAVFNGSPRGRRSNTRILLEHFLKGFSETEGNKNEVYYLNRVKEEDQFKQAFSEAEYVLLAFPLYTDSMPGVVKCFIEALEPFAGRKSNPALGFIIQSGFPEAVHNRMVAQYNKKLASRLGCAYLGTIVKGGVEGIQVQPPKMTAKLFTRFYELGRVFGRDGSLDKSLTEQLAKPERLSSVVLLLLKLLKPTGLLNFYWNKQLKKNGAYSRRFAAPYLEKVEIGT